MNPVIKPVLATLCVLCLFACKQKERKEKNPDDQFFPVLSYLQSQAADMDTSLYNIRKVIFVDSTRTDTIYLRREEFRAAAADFLSLPDLTASPYQDRYEQTKTFDETMNRVLMICTPLDPQKEEIQRQEVLIKPDAEGGKVTNIIVHTVQQTKDSLVEKRMLWQMNKSFQVTTTRQLVGQPETTSTYKVVWNEDATL